MDDGNVEESNASISIWETSAVDEGIGSNNRVSNETKNNTWSKDNPFIKIFPSNENAGLKIDVPENDNPLFYFKLLVSDELLGGIVQKSNEYARRVINSSLPLRRKSVLNKLKDVTLSQMEKFFDLVLHMELVEIPSHHAYWSRERFQSILRFLHFGDEPQQPDDRLAKVRFLIN